MLKKKPICKLSGEDGNVYNIIGLVQKSLKSAGMPDESTEFSHKALNDCHSYDEVIQLAMEYCKVT